MIWAEIAHWMALLPLAMLAGLSVGGHRCDPGYWWIAGGFSVSWLADTVAHWVNPWTVTLVYPITQTTLILAALLTRKATIYVLGALAFIAVITLVLRGTKGPDLILHSASSLVVVAVAFEMWELPARLRASLIVYFGAGLITWLIHVQWLVVATWYPYQAARLAGLLLFCYAAWRCTPSLKLARA